MGDVLSCIIIIGLLLYHWYSNGILQCEINRLHEKLNEYDIMYDQILMRDNLDITETGEWGYMWLSDTGLVWTEFQPERCTSIYVSKKDFINKWSKVK